MVANLPAGNTLLCIVSVWRAVKPPRNPMREAVLWRLNRADWARRLMYASGPGAFIGRTLCLLLVMHALQELFSVPQHVFEHLRQFGPSLAAFEVEEVVHNVLVGRAQVGVRERDAHVLQVVHHLLAIIELVRARQLVGDDPLDTILLLLVVEKLLGLVRDELQLLELLLAQEQCGALLLIGKTAACLHVRQLGDVCGLLFPHVPRKPDLSVRLGEHDLDAHRVQVRMAILQDSEEVEDLLLLLGHRAVCRDRADQRGRPGVVACLDP